MFVTISRRSVNCCRLLIRKYSSSTSKESTNTAIYGVSSIEQKVSHTSTSDLIPPDKLQFELSSSDVVKKDITFRYPLPNTGSSPPGIFAYYIKKSPLLQELFRLGVNFNEIEQNQEATQFILRCNFEDIREHILFLKELCIEIPYIASIISKNPLILKEDLDDLKVRVNYLKFKKFSDDAVTRVIRENPLWLTHSTQKIDELLGFFQKTFNLTGNEVRYLAVRNPKIITYNSNILRAVAFSLKEELGFTQEEIKKMVLYKSTILKHKRRLLEAFEFSHRTMNMPLERLAQEPEILTCRMRRLRSRHLFLEKLGKAQYNPKEPNYISLKSLVAGTDSEFCIEVAKTSIDMYNTFLKTY